MNGKLVLTDDLLRQALLRRMAHSPTPQLLDRIVTGVAGTAQVRAPRGWRGGQRPVRSGLAGRAPWWTPLRGLTTAAAVVVTAVLLVLATRPVLGPGATPTPPASPTPTVTPAATPAAIDVGGHQGLRLPLGFDAAPIDVTFADGSIWIANIHADDVRRYDPATLAELARIPVPAGQGPAWFAQTEGTLWVSNQLGGGMDRIDTATNSLVGVVGDQPTCGQPVVAFNTVWQAACDANLIMRIDPATGAVKEITADFYGFLVLAGDRMYAGSTVRLASFDPATETFDPLPIEIPGFRQLLASDGEMLWVATDGGLLRIDPVGGETLATFPYADGAVTFSNGRAWITQPFVGVVQVDLATNQVVQTIPLNISFPVVARELAGSVWVTDFDNSALWRIEP